MELFKLSGAILDLILIGIYQLDTPLSSLLLFSANVRNFITAISIADFLKCYQLVLAFHILSYLPAFHLRFSFRILFCWSLLIAVLGQVGTQSRTGNLEPYFRM